MAQLDYAKGVALIAADRTTEAEAVLHHAVELARTSGNAGELARALQGVGALYDREGRYADAAAAFRDAIAHLPRSATGEVIASPVYFERLADELTLMGQQDEAEREARRAVEIADRVLPEAQLDRPYAHAALAQTLNHGGHNAEALVEATAALAGLVKIQGTRGERYAETLELQGDILSDLERYLEAEPLLRRACEILAYAVGDGTTEHATCEVKHAMALAGLTRNAEAIAALDRVVAVALKRSYQGTPELADTYRMRGIVHAAAHHHAQAIADLERAIAMFATAQIEPGFLASARWRLGQELGRDQPRRARTEVAEAIKLFDGTTGWDDERTAAAAWLASHRR
jgi:tetratricopeptide (TPR) repeat protein